ncbi:FadR/GntR family transcriptional regulator [Clostridium sediminicola]|uniref:FadR/GntR family transcriptional regulator n=1 Tax=Clostridium sediminicola TaxID=3114879 RepID=UPI0031F2547F
MAKKNIINYFEKVQLPDPVDTVIEQIRNLLHTGMLKPGDKLPSERRLEDKMGVPRGVINRAMRMMETYGIVKTIPQSGTYVADICVEALEGLVSNIITLNENDVDALADTRCILERYATELVAENASDEELDDLELTQEKIAKEIHSGYVSFDKDMVFHLKIAAYSKNPVLKSVLTKLTVNMIDLLKTFEDEIYKESLTKRLEDALFEHNEIIKALKNRDGKEAALAMERHFDNSRTFRYSQLKEK